MGDGHPDIDDLPVTVGTLKTQGDIYPAGADAPQQRLIDRSGQQSLFGTTSYVQEPGVNPFTGSSIPLGADLSIGAALADYLETGIYNSSFFLPPLEPTSAISTDNPLPYWTVGGTAAATPIWQTGSLGASLTRYLSVSLPTVANGDDVYVEQVLPARGFTGIDAAWARATFSCNGGGAGMTTYLATAFFDESGTQIGSTNEATVGYTAASATDELLTTGGNSGRIPTSAAFVRVRLGVRSTAAVAVTSTFYIYGVRLYRSTDMMVVNSPYTAGGSGGGEIVGVRYNGDRNALEAVTGDVTNLGMRTFSPAIIALPFSFLNLVASGTNECQLWDVAVAQGSPYIDMAYRGSVIGISYRISGARTAGPFNIRARSGGGTVYLATGALGTGAALTGSTVGSVRDTGTTFAAGTTLGCEVVTSSLSPTTLDISILVYVALDVTG